MQVSDLYLYWKCHLFTVFFKHFVSANEVLGFSIGVTLVWNGLTKILKLTATNGKIHIYFEINFELDSVRLNIVIRKG